MSKKYLKGKFPRMIFEKNEKGKPKKLDIFKLIKEIIDKYNLKKIGRIMRKYSIFALIENQINTNKLLRRLKNIVLYLTP